jgi:hypothetical protein
MSETAQVELKRGQCKPLLIGDFNSWDGASHPLTKDAYGVWSTTLPAGRCLHSSTFQLNLSALYGIGGARRGCLARVKGVLRGV